MYCFLCFLQVFQVFVRIAISDCPKEINNTLHTTWNSTANGKCILSDPPCTDSNMELQRRCCENNQWTSNQNCTLTQTPIKEICPTGTNPFDEFCTIPSDSPKTCPYNYILHLEDYTKIAKMVLPIFRNVSEGIDLFRWTETTIRYKLPIFEEIDLGNIKSIEKNCVYYEGESKNYELIPCGKNHDHTCVYQNISTYKNDTNTYCKRKSSCSFPGNYNTDSKFFLIDQAEGELAELLEPHQKYLIPEVDDNSTVFSFGLKKIGDAYFWSGENSKITYSDWSLDVNYTNRNLGGFNLIKGWTLLAENSSSSITQHEVLVEEPQLVLKAQSSHGLMFLEIINENDLKLFTSFEDEPMEVYSAYCFTDSSPESLLTRLTVSVLMYNIYSFTTLDETPGKYWCEGIKFATLEVVRSNTIFHTLEKFYGNVFIVIFNYKYGDNALTQAYIDDIREKFDIDENYLVSFKKIISIGDEQTRNAVMMVKQSNVSEYDTSIVLDNRNYLLGLNIDGVEIDFCNNFDYCVMDYYENYYVFSWPFKIRKVSDFMYPKEIVIAKNGHLFQISCLNDYDLGGVWSENSPNHHVETPSNLTHLFKQLIYENRGDELLKKLYETLVDNSNNITELDVYLVAEILHEVSSSPQNATFRNVLPLCSEIMDLDEETLEKSQEKFNSTDAILTQLDEIYTKTESLEVSKNILYTSIDLLRHNLSCVMVLETKNTYKLELLYDLKNLTVLHEKSVAALWFEPLWREQIIKRFVNMTEKIHIKIAVYNKDTLYNNRTNFNQRPVSVVFDLMVPGFYEFFIVPVYVIYPGIKSNDNYKVCAYWSYKKFHPDFDDNQGFWFQEGGPDFGVTFPYTSCSFRKPGHLTLLHIEPFLSHSHRTILNRITIVNYIFSLLSLIISPLLFKKWRTNLNNFVLINLSASVFFQISLILISSCSGDKSGESFCETLGALLHFSVISQFSALLVVAFFDYKNTMDDYKTSILSLGSACLAGWIFSLIPVIYILIIDPKSYSNSEIGLCYPKSLKMYLSFWTPLVALATATVFVFCLILYEICKAETNMEPSQRRFVKKQLFKDVFLFVTFGVVWVSGFFCMGSYDLGVTYVFTFFSSLQGFLLLVCLILFDKGTRNLYLMVYDFIYTIH